MMVEPGVFLRSDAVATIFFAVRFVRLLFEGGNYSKVASISLENPTDINDGFIRYV